MGRQKALMAAVKRTVIELAQTSRTSAMGEIMQRPQLARASTNFLRRLEEPGRARQHNLHSSRRKTTRSPSSARCRQTKRTPCTRCRCKLPRTLCFPPGMSQDSMKIYLCKLPRTTNCYVRSSVSEAHGSESAHRRRNLMEC